LGDGSEFTFDSDRDGHPEYAPVAWWGSRSGNRYPPIVGQYGIIYLNNIFDVGDGEWDIPQGRIMGWRIGTPYFSLIGVDGALDEPQAISGGGNAIYRNICCDRLGDYSLINVTGKNQTLWDYSRTLSDRFPVMTRFGGVSIRISTKG
jgi:hypothetical protein